MDDKTEPQGKTIVETIEVTSGRLVDKVKSLAKDASVRRVKILAEDGDVFLDTPLNIGLVVGGVVILAAPWVAILGAIAALVSKARIEIEREAAPTDTTGKS